MLNFGDFLRSPAALGLAQGLLAGSQPSMTQPSSFGGALAQGLGLANQYQMAAQQDAYRRQQDALNNQRLQEQLGLSKEELGLRREKQAQDTLLSQFKMQQLNREQKLKEQQRSILQKALTGAPAAETGDESFSKEQRRRASILAATGDMEGAAKILAEKPEKNPIDEPTKQIITSNQSIIQAVDNVLPQLEELKKMKIPSQAFGIASLIGGGKQTAYERKAAAITEQLMSAMKLAQSDKGLELAKKLTKRGAFESMANYHKALEEVERDLKERRKRARAVTSAVGEKDSMRPASEYSDAELLAIIGRNNK